MKKLKFDKSLVQLVLSGEKTSTWRLFDDKTLSVGDALSLLKFGEDEPFGTARIIRVVEKFFKELAQQDKYGHESFATDVEMYETYSRYYKTSVGPDTVVKIIWFELVKP